MSKLRFLFDECTHTAIVAALLQQEPTMDIVRVGGTGAPASGTLDSDLLLAAEAAGRVLVTNDKKTMPGHLMQHFLAGHHTAGVVLLHGALSPGGYAQKIWTHWNMSESDDWIDRTAYVP